MPAIITQDFKRYILEHLEASVRSDSNTYYIGIGRSESWNDSDTVPTPVNVLREERQFRDSLQSVKIAEDISKVVPRVTWSSGTIYSAFDDNVSEQTGISPFYVLTDENNVFVCVERGLNADGTPKTSIVKPNITTTEKFSTADGYTWQYLYSIDNIKSSKFLTSNYMPVQLIDSAENLIEETQLNIQNASIDGEILNIVIENGGTGYTTAPTVTITGDGVGAAAIATISGGQVKRITMTERGAGYTRAKVSFVGGGGSGVIARAVLPYKNGLTADPTITLKAHAVMFNSKIDGIEGGDFIVENDFRQIGIIKNPRTYSNTLFTGNTGLVLRRMIVSDTTGIIEDETIVGTTSGSTAIIDYVDSDTIYFHQNEETGYGKFDSDVGGLITSSGTNTTLINLIDSADVDYMSGEILYIENRAPVIRNSEQIEDIKTIINL